MYLYYLAEPIQVRLFDSVSKWEEIEPIITDELTSQGIEVSVYDFG